MKSCHHGDGVAGKCHGYHADMVIDTHDEAGGGTVYVSLCLYLQDVAMPCVSEGETTLPKYQEESKPYTRLKKDSVYSNIICSLAVTLILKHSY